MAEKSVGIYLHIPFCLSKCHYCDFCSVSRAEAERIEAYTLQLCKEIKDFQGLCGKKLPIADTVYFGGGTPTLLSADQFDRILQTVDETFGFESGAEITAECNPKTADLQKLSAMRGLGINRLSIGMQSTHDNELRALGRIHSFEAFKKTYFEAREAGFDNVSADLMYGIPEQTMESFVKSMETLASLSPEHISSYCLTIEEGTNFARRRDSLALPDEDTVGDMYEEMSILLPSFGYKKYEISNFAKPGCESRHNLKYWQLQDYIGFGPAAHSCFENTRWGHSRNIDGYLAGKDIYDEVEQQSQRAKMNEYVMLGLRLADGISVSAFRERFGSGLYEVFPALKKQPVGLLVAGEDACRFTDEGMLVSNYLLSEILDFSRL